jgi:hypothetical protein
MTDMQEIIDQYEMSEVLVAKVRALARAYNALEIVTPVGTAQEHFSLDVDGYVIEGYLDILDEDTIYDDKFSGRPDSFADISHNAFQAMTYLLAYPKADKFVYRVVRHPGQKFQTRGNSEESVKQYEDRVYQDIKNRPAYYFQGWKKKDRTYGLTYWRSEFDLDAHRETLSNMLADLRHHIANDLWYPNTLSCYVPAPCQYLPIRKTGVISENLFEYRDVLEAKGGMK